jgi:hypothetical protein
VRTTIDINDIDIDDSSLRRAMQSRGNRTKKATVEAGRAAAIGGDKSSGRRSV